MVKHHLVQLVRRDYLLGVVFCTGATVLAVEVLAVRILTPYFGNTIFSFSSVLSVVLAALSVGYWYGGRLADRMLSMRQFYRLVTYAGLSVVGLLLGSYIVLPLVAANLSLVWGPLVAALLLFFTPGYLFGLLSPYVIALRAQAMPERGVGSVSGEVFFASTAGSIVGSLGSGFVLIPSVGVATSMMLLGCLVASMGILGTAFDADKRPLYAVVGIGALIGLTAWFAQTGAEDFVPVLGRVLYADDGRYERVAVVDMYIYGKEGRVLLLDRTYSSGVTLPDGGLLFPYTEYYKLYESFAPELRHALILGAGAGTVAKELVATYPDVQVDMVDIEPRVFEAAYEYFFVPRTDRIRAHVADGRQYLRESEGGYEFVFGDMYATLNSIPWHVSTREYYETLKERLAPGGVYVGNYIGSLQPDAPNVIWSSVRTLREVFGEVVVYAVDDPWSHGLQNLILVARKGAEVESVLRNADRESFAWQRRVRRVRYDEGILDAHSVFTDEHAPVELYSARSFD